MLSFSYRLHVQLFVWLYLCVNKKQNVRTRQQSRFLWKIVKKNWMVAGSARNDAQQQSDVEIHVQPRAKRLPMTCSNKQLSCRRDTALQGGSVLDGWWVMAWVRQYSAPNVVGARKLTALIFYTNTALHSMQRGKTGCLKVGILVQSKPGSSMFNHNSKLFAAINVSYIIKLPCCQQTKIGI